MQNRYFAEWIIAFPLPFLDVSIKGLVMIVGLAAILIGWRRSSLLLGLATLLASAYAWFVLGYVLVLADVPVLAFKTVFLIEAILGAAAGVGVVAVARSLTLRDYLPFVRSVTPVTRIATVGLVVSLFTLSSLGAIPYVGEQSDAREPSALLREFDRATGGRAEGDVVLTGAFEVSLFRPVYLFNVWNAHYSNPIAEFAARSRFLDRLAAEYDPALVAAALRHNRYDRVDVVMLDADAGKLRYVDYQDNFPRGTRQRTLTFASGQFDDRWFERSVVGEHAVFVARAPDPLDVLDAAQRRDLRRRFSGDLAIPNRSTAG